MKTVHISGDDRILLWAVVNRDAMVSVGSLVTNGQYGPEEKTARIVKQLDFVFKLRFGIAGTPASGGALNLDDIQQKYLESLLNETPPEELNFEARRLFYGRRGDLMLKIGDQERGNMAIIRDTKLS